ncbi:MAG: hypothetical protein HYZ75_11415 [Elusimicrobia bacterium]|nr:hypothetical protein [Elusimicrobiota bacterium]
MTPKLCRTLFSLALAAAPAAASTEDVAFGARAAALADAVTADAEGLGALTINPAAIGQIRRSRVEVTHRRLFQIPASPTDLDGMGAAAVVPVDTQWLRGAFGLSWTHDVVEPVALDRSIGLSFGSRSWRELGPGTLDAGITFKTIGRSGRRFGGATAKAGLDLGLYYRWRESALGLSILNINGPSTDVGPVTDRAPVSIKLGVSRAVRRFTTVADLTQREPTAARRASTSLGAGLEYSWATVKSGLLTGRSGLSVGSLGKSWTVGAGWSVLGASLDYAVRVPLAHGSRWSHVLSLGYKFGAWDPEGEYERLLRTEMSYRGDLSAALEAAEVKQWKLAEELRVMRGEMTDLRRDLDLKAAEADMAADRARRAEQAVRLKELEERRRRAEAELQKLDGERRRIKAAEREADVEGRFRDEWRRYHELKLQGVPNAVLLERLKNILADFKGKGVDLSEANLELQSLQRR